MSILQSVRAFHRAVAFCIRGCRLWVPVRFVSARSHGHVVTTTVVPEYRDQIRPFLWERVLLLCVDGVKAQCSDDLPPIVYRLPKGICYYYYSTVVGLPKNNFNTVVRLAFRLGRSALPPLTLTVHSSSAAFNYFFIIQPVAQHFLRLHLCSRAVQLWCAVLCLCGQKTGPPMELLSAT